MMWSIHTMVYYSVLKRKETLTLATQWINSEGIMLIDINQTQKDR